MNYQPDTAGNQTNSGAGFQDKFDAKKAREEVNQQYVLFLVWSSGSTNPQDNDKDAAFDGKEHDFDTKKPKSIVILSLSSKFEDCSANSSNEVNAAGFIVPTVRQKSLNSTNTFSATGPYNTAVIPTYGKSSFIDASQLPNDPDMPKLVDITYFNDEDVGGAEVDFNNLESSIPVREEIDQQYVLFPMWSSGFTNPHNNDEDASFDGKEHDFYVKKPKSEVILTPSSSAQSWKQDDKTKKEAKGKSSVESITGYRDLNVEFEDCSDNSSNEVNAADPLGKFEGKVDEGFLVGYSISSKAFKVFNSRTRIVQETLHVNFLENKSNLAGSQPHLLLCPNSEDFCEFGSCLCRLRVGQIAVRQVVLLLDFYSSSS
nr:retrovirus-related Pol polyprotein from transposon TNT 1-94 [Tanacetum cinerariifolium]